MSQIAHNIDVKKLIILLKEFKCDYVDIMIEDDFTVRVRPSEMDDRDGTIDINDLTV